MDKTLLAAVTRLIGVLALTLATTTAQGAATLSASPTTTSRGASITATWSGIATPTASDWIAMATPGAPNTSYVAWRYTTGTAAGSVPFNIPAGVAFGTYQLRLFAQNGYTLLATSNNFIVGPAVSGTVTLGGSGLAGVTFTPSGGGACSTSNASGQYTCSVPSAWSGSITPSLAGYGFSPASRSYTNVTANQTAQNYTATAIFQVSGNVTLSGSPLAGVAFAATSGGTCTPSDASGQYSCSVPQGWSGSVTLTLAGYVFSPASRTYSNVTANQTAQDYAATVIVQLSGTVTVGALPLGGIAFTATSGGSCTTTNTAGQYSCSFPSGWSGSVTPSLAGYNFAPGSRNYTNVTASQSAQDYVAAAVAGVAAIHYIHTDHLATPRVITNQPAQAVWRWDQMDPFGANVPNENPSGLGLFTCNLRLPGQYFDKETNLHYNYFRDYDPVIGRYIESDPIGLEGGVNTYIYVNNSPLVLVDPLGLLSCWYSISDHTLICRNNAGDVFATAQSGSGSGPCANNPACTAKKDEGPLPVGNYTIRRPGYAPNRPSWLYLDPDPTVALGIGSQARGGFFIHPMGRTVGCIVLTRKDFNTVVDWVRRDGGGTLSVDY